MSALWTQTPKGKRTVKAANRLKEDRQARQRQRSVEKRRAYRLNRVSPKRRQANVEYARLRAAFLKGEPICQRCRVAASEEVHHLRGRAGKLLLYVPCWMALCSACHRWVTDNPEGARKSGLLSAVGDWGRQPITKP